MIFALHAFGPGPNDHILVSNTNQTISTSSGWHKPLYIHIYSSLVIQLYIYSTYGYSSMEGAVSLREAMPARTGAVQQNDRYFWVT